MTLFLLLARSGAAWGSSNLSVAVDPRFELLGAVQRLAGLGESSEGIYPEPSLVRKRFAAFRSHPAVKAYAAAASRRPSEEAFGIIFFFLTEPPVLAWKVPRARLPQGFIESLGGIGAVESFLVEMRDFARASKFMEFYREHSRGYARYESLARQELDGTDYLALMQSYLRQDLDCRMTVILPLLYSRSRFTSFIWPYPYQGPGRKGKGPFSVFTIHGLPNIRDGRPYFGLGDFFQDGDGYKPLYIPVEWGFVDSEEKIKGLSALYGPAARDCPPSWEACAKHLVISALSLRISKRLLGRDIPLPQSPAQAYVKALASRLVEFEIQKARYPNFQSFFPRLVDEMKALAASP